jgi:hypothetical protein
LFHGLILFKRCASAGTDVGRPVAMLHRNKSEVYSPFRRQDGSVEGALRPFRQWRLHLTLRQVLSLRFCFKGRG